MRKTEIPHRERERERERERYHRVRFKDFSEMKKRVLTY